MAKLKAARDKAIVERKTQFTAALDGQGKHDFLVSYAGYLLQWLEQEFAKNPEQPRRPYNEGEEGQ